MMDQGAINALFDMTYGLYIVSACDGGKMNGQLTNTVFQVASEPPRMAAAINKENLTHEYISKSRAYSVSTLVEGAPMAFLGLFGFKSGRAVDKFAQIRHKLGKAGSPIVLEHVLSALEVRLEQALDVGTHTLFIGEITGGEVLAEGRPLTCDYYRRVMRGKTPRSATTYKPMEAAKDVRRP